MSEGGMSDGRRTPSTRTPFLSVASAEADTVLVAVISVFNSLARPQYRTITVWVHPMGKSIGRQHGGDRSWVSGSGRASEPESRR